MEKQRPRAEDPTNTTLCRLGQPNPPGSRLAPRLFTFEGGTPEIPYENSDCQASPVEVGHTGPPSPPPSQTLFHGAHLAQLATISTLPLCL